MSIRYRDASGQEVIAAGLTPGGDIEAGAVATRKGTITTESIPSGANRTATITFDSSMPDDDYDVIFTHSADFNLGRFGSKTKDGFSITVKNMTSAASVCNIDYTAIKTYTVQHDIQNTQAIADIQEAIPTGAGAANQLTTKSYVDNADSGLDLRIDDLEDLIPTGSTITNQLVNKSELQTAISNVHIDVDSALDSTSENPVQNKVVKGAIDKKQDKIFVGTTAEWNALTPTEQNVYKLVSLTNDSATGDVVDAVTNGVMKPVTSNAVYDILLPIRYHSIFAQNNEPNITVRIARYSFAIVVTRNESNQQYQMSVIRNGNGTQAAITTASLIGSSVPFTATIDSTDNNKITLTTTSNSLSWLVIGYQEPR